MKKRTPLKRKKAFRFTGKKQTCRCRSGHRHDSREEAHYCETLWYKKQSGLIREYEYEPSYPLTVNGKTIGSHKPDFLVTLNDGSLVIHEYKGIATTDWKLRRALFEALYPELPYEVKTAKDLL